jgi:hypothetical protein
MKEEIAGSTQQAIDDKITAVIAADVIIGRRSESEGHILITQHGERFNIETEEFEW